MVFILRLLMAFLTLNIAAYVPPVCAAGNIGPTEKDWQKLAPHPRLFADAARFQSLATQNDDVSQQLLALLRYDGDHKLLAPRIVYPTQGFKFGAVREAQGRILTLAMLF